jgi:hypothetical protein
MEIASSSVPGIDGDNACNGNAFEGSDLMFRCQRCTQIIANHEAVYMKNDNSYCSTGCRKRGSLRKAFTACGRSECRTSSESASSRSRQSQCSSKASSMGSSTSIINRQVQNGFCWVMSQVRKVLSAAVVQTMSDAMIHSVNGGMIDQKHSCGSSSWALGSFASQVRLSVAALGSMNSMNSVDSTATVALL